MGKELLSSKEIAHQRALGSMDRGDVFVEHIKRTIKPVPWPTDEELHKAYPDLKGWMRLVNKALGEVIEQFNIFFTDEERNTSGGDIYISFEVSLRECADWSIVMCGDEEDKCENIFEHLQIISPLMVGSIGLGRYTNIGTTTDS